MSEEMTMQDHPWIVAATSEGPQPVPTPTGIKLEPVDIEMNGQAQPMVLLTLTDQTGIKTVFFPPDVMNNIIQAGVQILQVIAQQQHQGLLIPNQEQEGNVKKLFELNKNLRGT